MTERKLEDNYPVFDGYLYVVQRPDASELVIRSQINGTVTDLLKYRNEVEGTEIHNCDIGERSLWEFMV